MHSRSSVRIVVVLNLTILRATFHRVVRVCQTKVCTASRFDAFLIVKVFLNIFYVAHFHHIWVVVIGNCGVRILFTFLRRHCFFFFHITHTTLSITSTLKRSSLSTISSNGFAIINWKGKNYLQRLFPMALLKVRLVDEGAEGRMCFLETILFFCFFFWEILKSNKFRELLLSYVLT